MAVEDHPRAAKEDATESLIGAAAAVLAARHPDIPPNFLADLYRQALPDDLQHYAPDDLAGIAGQAWSFLQTRKPGAAKIGFARAGLPRDEAILQIVNDDMPFLVDSVLGELSERGVDIRLLAHPVLTVERDQAGKLKAFRGASKGHGSRESYIHVHTAGTEDESERAEIVRALAADPRRGRHQRSRLAPDARSRRRSRGRFANHSAAAPRGRNRRAIQFLQWLAADNFTLLGARDYAYAGEEQALTPKLETGLGLLRSPDMRLLRRGNQLVTITPEIDEFLERAETPHRYQGRGSLARAPARQPGLHRRKAFRSRRPPCRRERFCGLFTSTAYTRSARAIPYLRHKLDDVISRAGFDPSSHSGKALVNVLENYPRDELFQIDEDTLYDFALAILQLNERPHVRVLPWHDRFDQFVSVLVYVPRDRYDSNIRAKIGNYLAAAFKGEVRAFNPFFPEGPLVRVHFIIVRTEGKTPSPIAAFLSARSRRSSATGSTVSRSARRPAHAGTGAHVVGALRGAFPADYREAYSPTAAVADIRASKRLPPSVHSRSSFYANHGAEDAGAGLKVFSHSRPIPLSERVPVLENMGFRVIDERTYHVEPKDAADIWLHDMVLRKRVWSNHSRSPTLKDNTGGLFSRRNGRTRRE